MFEFYVCYLVSHLFSYFGDNRTLRGRADLFNRGTQLLFILNIDSKRQSTILE